MKYRGDIDGLRAIAVLSVVVFHASPSALPGGYVGVDMFFVVSGFLISRILWDQLEAGTLSFGAFYARRAWRLLPALYATLAGTLATAFALFPPAELRQTGHSVVSAVASVSNVRFALQSGYFDDAAYRKPLLHTWSLAVEEQFYLLWPVALLCIHRYRERCSMKMAMYALAFLVLSSEVAVRVRPGMGYFLVPFRMYQFLLGAGLHLFETPASSLLHEALAAAGVLCTALSLCLFSGETPFPGIAGLLPTLATAALLHSPRSKISAVLANPLLAGIGRISYSVYLVHWSLIVGYAILSASRERSRDEILFLVAASLALGFALHHSVETRYRRGPPGVDEGSPILAPARTFVVFFFSGAVICLAGYGAGVLSDLKEFTPLVTPLGDRKAVLATRRPIAGFNVSEALRWERELVEPANGNWRTRLRKRPGISISLARRLAMHLKYRPRPAAKGRMLLFGDSHAEVVKPLAMRMAIEHGLSLDAFTMPACVGLLTLPSENNAHRTPFCRKEQAYWRRRIERSPYDVVLLAARWNFLTEEQNYGGFVVKRRIVLNRHGETPKTSTFRKRFKKLIGETANIVLRSGARLVLIGQAPNVGKNIRGCLRLPASKKAVTEGKIPRACKGATRKDVLRRSRFMDTLFEKMAYTDRRITAVTATNYFCDDFEAEFCRSVYGGRELYVDESHLSSSGSMFLSQRLKENIYEGIDFAYRNPKAKRPTTRRPKARRRKAKVGRK